MALLGGFHFEQVYSVRCLLDFLEFGFIRENIEGLNWVFRFSIYKLETHHAHLVPNQANNASATIWSNHAAVVVHPASLELDEGWWALLSTLS